MFYIRMDKMNCVKSKIEEIIKKSSVPEDPVHSKNTLEWLVQLEPDADDALQIAALGHDIERAIEHQKVKRKDYRNYDDFKEAHSLNSAKILSGLMEECNIDRKFMDDVTFLVRNHETGGSRRADILKNADSVSFFHVNLPYYLERNGIEETKRRCIWGYRRLLDNLKEVVAGFHYKNKELKTILKSL